MRRAVFTQKGSVGKFSIAVNLAAASAKPLVYLRPKHRLSLEFGALFQELGSRR